MAASKQSNPFRWVMLLFVCLFYFVILGFCNQSFNILLGTITTDMGWEPVQRTAVATAMSSGMIWFVFVAGVLMDKISAKKVLGSAVVLCAALIFLRGQAQGFTFFFMLMFVFGVASAFYMPACTKIISLWFGADELAFANGCLTSASPLGQITANLFAVKIMMRIGGWRMLYSSIGVCVLVIVFFFFFIAKERKSEDATLSSNLLTVADLGFWKNVKGIMKVPFVWVYAIANMCFLGAVYAGGAYGQLVLQTDPSWMLDKSISGQIPSFNNFASMFAYAIVPLLIAKIGRQHYRKIAILGGIIAPIAFYVGYMSYSFAIICLCMAVAGIAYGAIVPAPKVLMLQLPEVSGARAGTAMGFYTTVERIGITIFTATLGSLISTKFIPMSHVLGYFYLIQLVAPVLLIITMIILKNKAKKVMEG